MRPALAVLAVTAVFVALSPPGATSAQQKTNPLLLPRVLDLYSQGQFDEANRRVVTQSGFAVEEAERSINAGGRASLERRRLVAATCALEYAAARSFLIPQLVTWARTQVAGPQSPRPTEALWLRASIAIAEYFRMWTFLETGAAPVLGKRAPASPPVTIGHLTYAMERFPADPYFQMASVISAEYLTAPLTIRLTTRIDRGTPGFDVFGGDASDPASGQGTREARTLEHAAATAEQLLANPAVGTEARLRLGYIQMRLGRRDDALRNFDQIVASDARAELKYLAHLYSGLALARVNRASEASASYRAALRVTPGARTAATLLTAVLLTSGEIADAEEVAGSFLSQPANRNDPWDQYFLGDYPQFGELVGRLREALR